jgi:uncharacterized protein
MQLDAAVPAEPSFSDRIAVVDVLRAFALLGIVIIHSAMGFLAGPSPEPQFNSFSSLDRVVDDLVRIFTFGKFFAIFAFLFGLSFAIQLENSTRKGTAFSGRFTWRLVILLAIGFVHSLFFSGDILIIYAVLGLLLVPLRKVRSSVLIIAALIFILNVPGLVMGVLQVSAPPATPEQQQVNIESGKQFRQMAQRQFDIKQSGTLAEVVKLNFTESFTGKLFFQIVTGRLWVTFGLFLLGLYAGRMNIFRESDVNRHIFKRLLVWAGSAALITSVIAIVYPGATRAQSLQDVLSGFAFSIQQASLAAFYVAAITLLFWKKPTQGLLPRLAPMGKMGLTTYLTQSVFGLVVFYGFGFGLLGKLGVASCVAIGILFFIAQMYFARWWMSYFNLGPAEWLWRSLTYFKAPANIRVPAPRLA